MDNTKVLILCLACVAVVALFLQSRTHVLTYRITALGSLLAKLAADLRRPVGLLVCFDVFIDHDANTNIPELERLGSGQEIHYAHRFVLADGGVVHFGTLTKILAERENGLIVFRHVSPIYHIQQVDGAPANLVLDFRTLNVTP